MIFMANSIEGDEKICEFVTILPNSEIGSNCDICSHRLIESDVVIYTRFAIKSGVQIWGGLCIDGDIFIGSNINFTNDQFLHSKQYHEKFSMTTIKCGASIEGGGSDSARTHRRRIGDGWRRGSYNKVGARRRYCRQRPCSHHQFQWGEQ
jgi:NDP-sugar pyrophosphorylase family protein